MLHSLARTVKGHELTTPSETRLLGAVIAGIVAFIFLSTLINPPHWLHVAGALALLIGRSFSKVVWQAAHWYS